MLKLSPPIPTSSFQASFECGLHVVASYDEDGTESRERREHGRHCKPCCYYVSLRFVGRRALHLPDHLPQTHQLYLEKKPDKSQLKGTLQTFRPAVFRIAKIVKNKQWMRNCHNQKGTRRFND